MAKPQDQRLNPSPSWKRDGQSTVNQHSVSSPAVGLLHQWHLALSVPRVARVKSRRGCLLKPLSCTYVSICMLLAQLLQGILGNTVNDFEDPKLSRHVHCRCKLDLGHNDFVFPEGFQKYRHTCIYYWADVDPGGCL